MVDSKTLKNTRHRQFAKQIRSSVSRRSRLYVSLNSIECVAEQYFRMEKIVVKWTEGRSKGATSLVKRSAIKGEAIAIEENVSVVWRKSKKTYNAEVVDDGSSFNVPRQVTRGTAGEAETLTLKLYSRSCPRGNPRISALGQPASFDHEARQPCGCCCRVESKSSVRMTGGDLAGSVSGTH